MNPSAREPAVREREGVRRYSLARVLAAWAAAAVPTALLAWVVAPLLEPWLGEEEPFAKALLLSLTAGLMRQFVLVVGWSRVGRALRWPPTGGALVAVGSSNGTALTRVRSCSAARGGGSPWFVALGLFNTVLGEELLFRGLLLARMQRVCGRGDWLANGVLIGLHHLHQPYSISRRR